jgi:hypothetical protein
LRQCRPRSWSCSYFRQGNIQNFLLFRAWAGAVEQILFLQFAPALVNLLPLFCFGLGNSARISALLMIAVFSSDVINVKLSSTDWDSFNSLQESPYPPQGNRV